MAIATLRAPERRNDAADAAERQGRIDLACALRWAARYDWHEAVANHFSLTVDPAGRRFLINPRNRHFARIRASELVLVDADDPATLDRPDAPERTAWHLHGAIHRRLPHARAALHVHSPYATVLATLADSRLKPIDQNGAMFFNRVVVDEHYGGLALEAESERCVGLFTDPAIRVMVMGNHGVLVLGDSVADAFNRLYYFERAAKTYVMALSTGQPLRALPDAVAERTAREVAEEEGAFAADHFAELTAILDAEEPNFRD